MKVAVIAVSMLLLTATASIGGTTGGVRELTLTGDRLTLVAESAPLQTVLEGLADRGIRVKIDPALNPAVSVSIRNRPVDQGIAALLSGLDHALLWEAPSKGAPPRLAEIQIFRPGFKSRMRDLTDASGFSVVQDPQTGAYFVRDEILVRKRARLSVEAFEKLVAELGGVIVGMDDILDVYRVRLPYGVDVRAVARRLAATGDVDAEPNWAYRIALPYGLSDDPPAFPAPAVGSPAKGSPVAVLDTGLMAGYGLEETVLASFDAVDPENSITDHLGHGTQMAMIASGLVRPMGVAGTETDAATPVIAVRSFDDNGFTTQYTLMKGIEFAIENGAKVLSLSWGTGQDSAFLSSAFTYAESKGLIVVASAGNEPTGEPVYPAAYPSVIGVGALGPDGTPWQQSNFGEFVSVAAPGFADFPVGYKGQPGGYAGTSISAAFVAREAARFLDENPGAGKQEVLAHLRARFGTP